MDRGGQGRGKKTRSAVWEHFNRLTGDDGSDKAQCKRCLAVLHAGTDNGTSSLWRHTKTCKAREMDGRDQAAHVAGAEEQQPLPNLQQAQDEEMQQQPPLVPPLPVAALQDEEMQQQPPLVLPLPVAALQDEDRQQQQLPPLLPPLPPPGAPSSSTGEQQQPCRLSDDGPGLGEQAHQHHHHGPGLDHDQGEEARRELVRMVALHGHHPSIVEDAHFRSFVRRLNPRFKLPTREDIDKACDSLCDHTTMAIDPRQQVAPGASSFAVGTARSVVAGREVLYITCNLIDDEWKLHRLVDQVSLVLPPGDHYNASASTFLGVPVVSAEVAAQRVVSYVLSADEYYPLMVTGDSTGSIGLPELKRLVDQKQRSFGNVTEAICTASVDHLLNSVARALVPASDVATQIFSSVLDSKWARKDRQKLLSELGLDDPFESSEQWYWCYCSLAMADQELLLTLDSQTVLCNLWGAICSSIKRLCASIAPTSHLCLEELLKVRGLLQSQLSATIAAHIPIANALEIVDKAIEDSYQLWSVPLVMDPRYKLRHIEDQFQKAFDGPKATHYISQVRSMVKELYISFKDDLDDSDDSVEEMIAASQDDEDMSELEDYLDDSRARTREGTHFDVLKWWRVYGSDQYPSVARLARAALAMPTCSKLDSSQTAEAKSLIRGYTKL